MSGDEVLGDLALVDHLPDADPDLGGVGQPPGVHHGLDLGELGLGGGQQPLRGARRARRPGPGCGRRSAARRGSPGELISARSWVSNSLICSGPSSSASFLMAGARRQVSHAMPGISFSALIRALVIIPRSPTMTASVRSNLLPHHLHGLDERLAGSPVLPANTRTATGRPSRVGEQPVLDLRLAALAVAGMPERGQLAVAAFHPRAGQVEQRHPALRPGGGGPARPRCASWRATSQSIAAYTSSVDAPATPRSAPRVVSSHQPIVDSFEAGRATRETISA